MSCVHVFQYSSWCQGLWWRFLCLCDSPHQINVCQGMSGSFLINGVSVRDEDCKLVLKRLIQQDPDNVIRLKVDDDMLYGDYMEIVTSAMEALDELKEENSYH